MNLTNYCWIFKSAISVDQCQRIIDEGHKSFKKAKIHKNSELKNTRNSKIVWLNNQYLFDMVNKYAESANKNAGWNFQVDFIESLQLTRYTKNQFYHWHRDARNEPYENNHVNVNFRNKTRKISMTLNLTDPSTYEGGDLEFNFQDTLNDKKVSFKESKLQGSITFFPSFVFHRVTPVTKGTRWSLVAWMLGRPYN
tara:strand:+ start:1224 stop:1811 length:588 start_codon:yes stop_codon:yes gene_type:complete